MNIECPKCKSYKTLKGKGLTFIMGLILTFIAGFIGIFIFPLLFLVPVGLVMLVAAPFIPNKKAMCFNCNYTWNMEKVKIIKDMEETL